MAIYMTRDEYRTKYGSEPVFNDSELDTTPAPRMMTRAEYQAEFGVAPGARPQAQPQTSNFWPDAGNRINEFNPAYQIPKVAISGAQKAGQGFWQAVGAKSPGELLEGGAKFTAGTSEALLSPLFGTFEAATNLPGIKQAKNFLWGTDKGTLPGYIGDKLGNLKPLQTLTDKYPQAPEVASDIITTGFGLAATKGEKQIQQGLNKAKETFPEPPPPPPPGASKSPQYTSRTLDIADELSSLQDKYASTRRQNFESKDGGVSSNRRIAESGVLDGAVDTDGTIRTMQPGGAVDQYAKLKIDGTEGVVRDLLIKEGKTVNLEQVRHELLSNIYDSKLEGSDLVKAINGVEREIQGLKLRADSLGEIPLSKVHDAKIATTKSINYGVDSNPTITYRKAVAKTYKEIVEKTSKAEVAKINKELGKYLEDIERLKTLDGKKVRGGKLGKYFSQISGNIIGGAAGGAVGGPVGMALGTVVGGETASFIKGKTMEGTFDGGLNLNEGKSPILEQAKAAAQTEPVAKLKVPDKRVGAPKSIPKTKEIYRLEKAIDKNVKDQKAAIQKGDFALVAALKEIYQALVAKLKAAVKAYKEMPNKEGGFLNFGQSNKSGSRNTQYANSSTATKSPIDLANAKIGEESSLSAFEREALGIKEEAKGEVKQAPERYDSKSGLPLDKNGYIDESALKETKSPYFESLADQAAARGDRMATYFREKYINDLKEEYARTTNNRRMDRLEKTGKVLTGGASMSYQTPKAPSTSFEKSAAKVREPKFAPEEPKANFDSKSGLPLADNGLIDTVRAKKVLPAYFKNLAKEAAKRGVNMARLLPDKYAEQIRDKYIEQTNNRRFVRLDDNEPVLQANRADMSYRMRQFERAKDLSPEDAAIETKAYEKILEKENEMILRSAADNGKVVNADTFKNDFRDVGYNGANAAAVHEPSSYLAKKAFTFALKHNEGRFASFLAGGSGTGKTSAVKKLPEYQKIYKESAVLLDSNLSNYESALKKIEEAKRAGKKAVFFYVYRDPIKALRGVVERMIDNPEEAGRLVRTFVMAKNHIGSLDVAIKLRDAGYEVYAVDNDYGRGQAKVVDLNEIINKANYPTEPLLREMLNREVKKLHDEGIINRTQYEAYIH